MPKIRFINLLYIIYLQYGFISKRSRTLNGLNCADVSLNNIHPSIHPSIHPGVLVLAVSLSELCGGVW